MKPTIGRIVCYSLSLADIEHIETQRQHVAELLHVHPGQIGNTYVPGDIAPLLVTRVWSPHLVNGQVILDGGDTLWKTSATLNHQPASGTWHWPVIEPAVALVAESVAPINAASDELLRAYDLVKAELERYKVSEAGLIKDTQTWRDEALASRKMLGEQADKVEKLEDHLARVRGHETHLLQERDRLIHGDLADLHEQVKKLIAERDEAVLKEGRITKAHDALVDKIFAARKALS